MKIAFLAALAAAANAVEVAQNVEYDRKIGEVSAATYGSMTAEQQADYDGEAPHCWTGTAQEADKTFPADHCCRVYENEGYIGRYYDFCIKDPATQTE